ncbi:hypothetical protein HNP84_002301 [Thermocatellispora tengchongensis]|uniref:Uncharacterized protein n=1 Tax=Thermocatellispora tengchongensis TaxID=1073253 RepID=A0A840P9B8_9ACTN|nr:hypothetical protein [Thermocatellispora tengchongensis]MBB5132585.1 hypothetical protein [Thermocatellispora tengchongensis]
MYAASGDESRADSARDKVLAQTRDYQYRANVMLHQALCTVAQGGVDEGARNAAAVIDSLGPSYRSNHIIETGRMVLQAVPKEHRERPPVAELRAVLTAGT